VASRIAPSMTLSSPVPPVKRSLASIWLIWIVVVFGALNIHSSVNPDILGDPPGASAGKRGLANILVLLRDDGDTRRYFAYAEAILGRPYDSSYVQPGNEEARASHAAHAIARPDRPLLPWRDFTVEYPPGMLVVALLPALFTSDFPTYHLLFSLLMGLLLTGCAWLVVKTARRLSPGSERDALQLSTLFVAALGVVAVRRYDALVAFAIAAALYGLVGRKPARSGLGLAVGVIAKVTPLLLAPIGVMFWVRRGRWRELRVAAAASIVTGAVAAAIYFVVARDHAFDTLAYHVDRPVQIESPYGAILILAELFHHGLIHIVSSYGSHNIQSSAEPPLRQLSSVFLGGAILGVLGWFWWAIGRARDEASQHRAVMAACTAALIAFIALGKVFSPQYLLWLLPSGAIAAALSSERSRLAFIVVALLTQLEFPFVYQVDTSWREQLIAAVAILRDGAMIACAVSLMIEASRACLSSRSDPVALKRSRILEGSAIQHGDDIPLFVEASTPEWAHAAKGAGRSTIDGLERRPLAPTAFSEGSSVSALDLRCAPHSRPRTTS
jgi:hypothetical protein